MSASQANPKVVLIGDSGVGKTSIYNRCTTDSFIPNNPPTIGVLFSVIERSIKGTSHVINLWDTAGQEAFRSVIPNYTRDADAVILVFSVEKPDSFEHVEKWKSFVLEKAQDPRFYLVGNMVDCPRRIDYDAGFACATKLEMPYFETSAMTGVGIEELLTVIMTDTRDVVRQPESSMLQAKGAATKADGCC
jgi:Ras-related protein Rab-6A